MARAKKKSANANVVTLQLAENAAGSRLDDEEMEELDELEGGELSRSIEELRANNGVQVEVYRLLPAPERGFCANYPVAAFTQEKISEEWGPGKYRIRYKGDDNRYLKGGGTLEIASRPRQPGNPAAAAASGVQDVLAIMKAEREKEKSNYWEIARLLLPLIAPKLLDLLGGQKGPSLTELMAVINGAKEFHRPEPQASLADQFEQFAQMMDLAQKMSGGKDSNGATWVDLIRDGINKVPEVLAAARGGIPLAGPLLPAPEPLPSATPTPAPDGPASPATAAPAAVSSTGTPRANGSPMDLRMLPWLKQTLEQLLVQAANDRDPEMYAAVTMDNLPNFVAAGDLLRFLQRPNWWELACAQEPRLSSYPGWFQRYHAHLSELLAEEVDPPPPQAPAAGLEEEFH